MYLQSEYKEFILGYKSKLISGKQKDFIGDHGKHGELERCSYKPPVMFHIYRVGQKTGLFFRLDNFVMVSPRKTCSMSKFSQFYREKGTKLAFQLV